MAQRRREERARKAELNRLDNEECGEDEEEEEDMTDESEEEEVRMFVSCCFGTTIFTFISVYSHQTHLPFYQGLDDLLGGDGAAEEEEEEGSVAQSVRSPSPVALSGPSPTPYPISTDGTLLLFPGSSCSRTG